jgi:DNA-binding MarR family transcriptional regulator
MSPDPAAAPTAPTLPALGDLPAETVERFGMRLEDQLCFALYAASRTVTSAYRPLLDRLGLTYPQYLVMLALWQHGASSIKDLGTALSLDYGTLTPLLKRLEARGLIRRQRQADDERSVRVDLTGAGQELQAQARMVPPLIGTAMGLTDPEFTQLRTLLRKLTGSVAQHAAP